MTIETQQLHQEYYPIARGKEEIKILWPLIHDKRGFIGGSFAAWLMSKMETPITPHDIDIFARSEGEYHFLSNRLIDNGGVSDDYTENTVTFRPWRGLPFPIQLVKPSPSWHKYPDDLIDNFDLNVSRAIVIPDYRQGIDSPGDLASVDDSWRFGGVLADRDAGTLFGKILRINDPLRTLKRVYKYQARGVQFSDHELLKLFGAWETVKPEVKESMITQARRKSEDNGVDSSDWNRTGDDDYICD